MSRKRAFWRIVEEIEALIASGDFAPGSRLPAERDLADQFNVSRPTIREAIIALEVKGIVNVKTNSGIFINKPAVQLTESSVVSAFELTQARALVEGESAALAALSITQEELQTLDVMMQRMANGDDSDLADKAFHLTIAKATRNDAIVKTIEYLWSIRENQPSIVSAYKTVCDDHTRSLAEHQTIYNALVAGDSSSARSEMHNHFNRLINALFDISEQKAMDEVKRKAEENRDRYSLSHLHKSQPAGYNP